MPNQRDLAPLQPASRLLLVTVALAGITSCSEFGSLGNPFPVSEGCNPQVPLAPYRIQAEIPVGTLEVKVLDASGSPVASASVEATRLVYTGARCMSTIAGETDAAGMVRFERMKTGPYSVDGPENATASAQVENGQTTTVTLTPPR